MASKKEEAKSEVTPVTESTQIKDVFNTLVSINVNEHVEKKDTGKTTLSYLSWVYAWSELRKRFKADEVSYVVHRNEAGLPYFADPTTGLMVFTTVTVKGESRDMWLPVMDGANNAMKLTEYKIHTKFGDKTVAPASMFDINKAIMRCLAKNIAMFGLGLYIYAGEDLPEETAEYKSGIDSLISKVDEEINRMKGEGKLATAEAKKELISQKIQPIIGSANYKLCRDESKLNALLSALQAA